MKNKVIVVACEGLHDISFITRILHAAGFKNDDRKINEFPFPFNKLFSGISQKMVLANRKLGYQSPNFLLPSGALVFEDKIVFLHSLNGDGRSVERIKLITQYSELIGDDDFSKDLNFEFRFLFFFDADDYGVMNRLSDMTIELDSQVALTNGTVISHGKNEIGCYIYHDNDSNTGVLEDLLLKHFSCKDYVLKDKIVEFLSDNVLCEERTRELYVVDGEEVRKGRSKFSEKKSMLSLFGQLQFSGMSNSVIISKSDFLNIDDINGCEQCINIKGMFS